MSATNEAVREDVRVVVSVDDTDDLTKVTSTGAVADALMALTESLGGVAELGVSRHQLPRLPGIAYTSHNSSMTFTATMPSVPAYERLLAEAPGVVVEGSVAGSDPGLCVYALPEAGGEAELHLLLEYGTRAKHHVMSKADAYGVAAQIAGMTLVELGGNGEGIIGALAGVALRLSGSDGRFRGTVSLFDGEECTTDVSSIVAALGGPTLAQVCDVSGMVLDGGERVVTRPNMKAVWLHHKVTLLVTISNGGWHVLDKVGVRDLERPDPAESRSCDQFEADNDPEEMDGEPNEPICANCLYSRRLEHGAFCMKHMRPS